MKRSSQIVSLVLLLLSSGCVEKNLDVRWQIKKNNPAFGLTLGYYLPMDKIQKIIGNEFKPEIDENGNGYLMLFIATSQQYFLDSLSYDELRIAHILVGAENSLNCPLTIGSKDQKLNEVLEQFGFKIEEGDVDLLVKQKKKSIHMNAEIVTRDGSIELISTFNNNPDDWVYHESTKVSATANPNSYFIGGEGYSSIQIDSMEIKTEGVNWFSELNLPAKPDDIWLNTDFTWDFTFAQNSKSDSDKK